jgi:hypothetical protein
VSQQMKDRFRLFRRGWGTYYVEDTETGKQQTLQTTDKREAQRMVHARNEAQRTPHVNLMIAKAYLAASDPALTNRTWQHVINAIIETKTGDTRHRWETAAKDHALDRVRDLPLVKTQAEDILDAIKRGTVSTNVYLRRLHNYAWDMNWLLGPVIVRRHWPRIRFKEKRAITLEEHRRIIEREGNDERRAFYEMCWHLGGAQSDIACLQAEDVDWGVKTISYERRKLKGRGLRPSVVQFGPDVEKLLVALPSKGPLFPYLATVRAADRATEFGQRCRGLGIVGVTLHSYRYAWAERAGRSGYPERFAMQSLGHNSKAVHHGYARKALVVIPSLQQYEEAFASSQANVIPLQLQQARSAEFPPAAAAK